MGKVATQAMSSLWLLLQSPTYLAYWKMEVDVVLSSLLNADASSLKLFQQRYFALNLGDQILTEMNCLLLEYIKRGLRSDVTWKCKFLYYLNVSMKIWYCFGRSIGLIADASQRANAVQEGSSISLTICYEIYLKYNLLKSYK